MRLLSPFLIDQLCDFRASIRLGFFEVPAAFRGDPPRLFNLPPRLRGTARSLRLDSEVAKLGWHLIQLGLVGARPDYDEWGKRLGSASTSLFPFGFAGGSEDLDSGLVRFGRRDFLPEAGVWTAKDPLRFAAGSTGLFSYSFGDPVNRLDSSGLETCVAVWTGLSDLHAAMAISNNGAPVLFDPSGSYPGPEGDSSPTRGSGDAFYGDEANFQDYLNYWEPIQGSPPEVTCFATSNQEEAQIADRIDQLVPRDSSLGCAADVSAALAGIGPFDSLRPTSWPPSLASQLRDIALGTAGATGGGW